MADGYVLREFDLAFRAGERSCCYGELLNYDAVVVIVWNCIPKNARISRSALPVGSVALGCD